MNLFLFFSLFILQLISIKPFSFAASGGEIGGLLYNEKTQSPREVLFNIPPLEGTPYYSQGGSSVLPPGHWVRFDHPQVQEVLSHLFSGERLLVETPASPSFSSLVELSPSSFFSATSFLGLKNYGNTCFLNAFVGLLSQPAVVRFWEEKKQETKTSEPLFNAWFEMIQSFNKAQAAFLQFKRHPHQIPDASLFPMAEVLQRLHHQIFHFFHKSRRESNNNLKDSKFNIFDIGSHTTYGVNQFDPISLMHAFVNDRPILPWPRVHLSHLIEVEQNREFRAGCDRSEKSYLSLFFPPKKSSLRFSYGMENELSLQKLLNQLLDTPEFITNLSATRKEDTNRYQGKKYHFLHQTTEEAPPFLLLQLQRYQGGSGGNYQSGGLKITEGVSFLEPLTVQFLPPLSRIGSISEDLFSFLMPYHQARVKPEKQIYSLQSVIFHLGNSLHSGHYLVAVNHGDYWSIHNDEQSVEFMPTASFIMSPTYQTILTNGYLFLFVQASGPPPPSEDSDNPLSKRQKQ